MKKYGFGGESSTYVFVAAVAIFSTILGFSFGATWRGSVFESAPFGWVEFWLSRYQTGLTIIVAVLIAKQQMDAARRQHIASVKRSFRDQLDVIRAALAFCDSITRYSFDQQLENRDPDADGFQLRPFDKQYVDKAASFLTPDTVFIMKELCDSLGIFHIKYMGGAESEYYLKKRYSLLQLQAAFLRRRLKDEHDDISQYWS
ncbi:hypothetical protein [Brucella anthropi]|uniref:hypothetical protein n=1 Tax=Brucella anthropi TaxID=529 RepID=UPI000F676D09|nr:hypothetical protein [Brucella anthropi]RRY11376.1 hypothetical protein EGJ58_06855 [Brucella anthropi]